MRPLRVEAFNLGSWEHLDFTFPDGVTAITGRNGAGKSTMLAALDLALFADKGELAKALRDGETQVEVVAEIEVGGEVYRVTRGAGRKSFLDFAQIVQHDDDGVVVTWEPLSLASQTETQALIEQTLGLSRDTFRASAFLGQGAASFAEATPKQRMDLFSALLGLGTYETLAQRAHDQLADAKREIDRLDGALEGIASRTADGDEINAAVAATAQAVEERTQALAAAQAARDAAEESYRQAERSQDAVRAAQAELQAALSEQARLAAITRAADDARVALADLAPKRGALAKAYAELPGAEQREADLRAEVAAHERLVSEHKAALRAEADAASRIAELTARADRTDAAADDLALRRDSAFDRTAEVCDRCGQTLSDEAAERMAFALNREVGIARHEAEALRAEAASIEIPHVPSIPAHEPPLEALKQAAAATATARNAWADLGRLDERAKALEQTISQDDDEHKVRVEAAGEIARRATAALATAEETAASPDRLRSLSGEVTEGRANVAYCERDVRDAERESAAARERLRQYVAAVEQERTLEAERETVQTRADVLTRCEQAHGRTGIPSLILENRSAGIEHDATRILNELGGATAGARVELRTLRETKAGTQQARLDVNIVTAEGLDRPFGRWSGGERMRIDFALRWAVSANLGMRFLILDEPAAALDAEGKAAFLEIVEFLSERLDSVLVVSHTPELRDALPQTVEVARAPGGASHLISHDTTNDLGGDTARGALVSQ